MKTFLLTPALGKAARALLEWQQANLAEAAHLSLTAVNNFERKIGATRDSTLQSIQTAFEEHGVEFLPGGGLRRIDEVAEVTRFSGKNFITDWTYAFMRTALKSGDEIFVSSSDEQQWFHPHHLQSTKDFFVWLKRFNLKVRTLISDNEKTFQSPLHNYRTVPSEIIGKISYVIYGPKIGFVLWKKKQVIVLHNAAVAETFRNQFNYLWKMGKPVH